MLLYHNTVKNLMVVKNIHYCVVISCFTLKVEKNSYQEMSVCMYANSYIHQDHLYIQHSILFSGTVKSI